MIACFRSVLREEGWRMVMRGYTPTVFGSCIYSGISFFTYETLKIVHAGNLCLLVNEVDFRIYCHNPKVKMTQSRV